MATTNASRPRGDLDSLWILRKQQQQPTNEMQNKREMMHRPATLSPQHLDQQQKTIREVMSRSSRVERPPPLHSSTKSKRLRDSGLWSPSKLGQTSFSFFLGPQRALRPKDSGVGACVEGLRKGLSRFGLDPRLALLDTSPHLHIWADHARLGHPLPLVTTIITDGRPDSSARTRRS